MRKRLSACMTSLGLAAGLLASLGGASALQLSGGPVQIDSDDIGGVVNGPRGPEAGVWVVAETSDLPTKFAKVVVTNEGGQYVLPDLPKANYNVWVRGYGLVDSPKVRAVPGQTMNLTAAPAPNEAAAAQYYPPIYWFSMLRVPATNEFPLEKIKSQGEWLNIVKSG